MLSLGTQYIIAAILLIIAYYYCIHVVQIWNKAPDGWKARINAVHEMCLVQCDSPTITSKLRGSNYYIGVMNQQKREKLSKCLVTFWSMTHFVLYGVIGFFCPDIFWEMLAVGTAFEVYEKTQYGCHDWTDIAFNTLGYYAGSRLRRLIRSEIGIFSAAKN